MPPQHKKDFASAFLKTKEQVLRANGGVKRVDLLEVWRLAGKSQPLNCKPST